MADSQDNSVNIVEFMNTNPELVDFLTDTWPDLQEFIPDTNNEFEQFTSRNVKSQHKDTAKQLKEETKDIGISYDDYCKYVDQKTPVIISQIVDELDL